MPTFLIEDNQSLHGKNIPIPKNILNTLKQNNQEIDNMYSQIGNNEYKKLDGYKRNQRLTNDNYNNRSDIDKEEGYITYNDLVKWKYDIDHMPKNDKNISYQLNGGKDAENFVNNTLSKLRNSVKPQNKVKKSENISKSELKPIKNPTDTIKINNQDVHIKENIYNESNNFDYLAEVLKRALKEVRYINSNEPNQEPISNNEVLRVFHGFDSIEDALLIAQYGTSGKSRHARKFSYENGMNPNGLFVTTDFKIASNDFSYGKEQVVMEFSARTSDLDSPVWNNQGSYFGQFSNPKPFKNRDEREAQKQVYQNNASNSEYEYIKNSGNPAMAQNIFHNNEHQALFVGDLNPNMIKRFWVMDNNSKRWIPYDRNSFLKTFGKREISMNKIEQHNFPDDKLFLPNEDFVSYDDLLQRAADKNNKEFPKFKSTPEKLRYTYDAIFDKNKPNVWAISTMLYPKQIIQMYGIDFYRQYFNPLSSI